MSDPIAKINSALVDFTAETEQLRLDKVIEEGLKPAGTTIDDLSPVEQVDYLGRNPVDAGLPADWDVEDSEA
ncbi:hypothetical protein ACQPZJ_44290 [Actinoplanes sp. CA-054009]